MTAETTERTEPVPTEEHAGASSHQQEEWHFIITGSSKELLEQEVKPLVEQFNITTTTQTVQGIGHQYCQLLQKSDGYRYTKGGVLPPHA